MFSIESVGGECECSLAGTKPKADFEVEIYIRHLPEYALLFREVHGFAVLFPFEGSNSHNLLIYTLS